MKRQAKLQITYSGEFARAQYEQVLRASKRTPGYIFKKSAVSTKLIDVSPHDLRRHFGYRMTKSVPLPCLTQIMGHDSLDTPKLYIQGTKRDLQRAVKTIAWV